LSQDSKISFKQRIDFGKESSLLVWYPRIKGLPIPQVQTEIAGTGHKPLYDFMVNEKPIPENVYEKMYQAMERIGKYPMFMRTDQSSAKHSWKDTCFLTSKDKLNHNLSFLIENHEMQNMAGELGYEAVVFREFLDLESYFTTDFYGDFPVNKEVRCFIRDGSFVSMHNYWFDDAVKQGHPHDTKWRAKLKKLNTIGKGDKMMIKAHLNLVSPRFQDYWSVDFAKGKNGIWYLIDMARGEVSYHPENVIEKFDDMNSKGLRK